MKAIVLLVLVALASYAAAQCTGNGLFLGLRCVSNCPTTHQKVGNRCYYNPKPVGTSKTPMTGKCSADVMGMFFSWTVYEQTPNFIMKSWAGTPRIESCGNWVTVNEFHKEALTDLINIHVSVNVNEAAGTAMIAFRGTELDFDRTAQMISNWAANFAFAKKPFSMVPNCGEVHSGFYKNYQQIDGELNIQVSKFLSAGYKVIFTGHSYGGALSVIAAARFMSAYPNQKSRIGLVTYAAPRVGNKEFGACFSRLSGNGATHFVAKVPNGPQDIVPTVPLEIMGFVNTPGSRLYVACNKDYIGNPRKIPGISIGGSKHIPASVGCHFQQPYLDGIIEGRVTNYPLGDLEEEMNDEIVDALADSIAEQILADFD